jgi:hypothetical protein
MKGKVGPHSYLISTALLLFIMALLVWNHVRLIRVVQCLLIVVLGIGVLRRNQIARVVALLLAVAFGLLGALFFMVDKGVRHRVPWEYILLILSCTFAAGALIDWDTEDYPLIWSRCASRLPFLVRVRWAAGWFIAACLTVVIVVFTGFYILTFGDRLEIERILSAANEDARDGGARSVVCFAGRAGHEQLRDGVLGLLRLTHPEDVRDHRVTISWNRRRAKITLERDSFIYLEKSQAAGAWMVDFAETVRRGEYRGTHEGPPHLYWGSDLWWWSSPLGPAREH